VGDSRSPCPRRKSAAAISAESFKGAGVAGEEFVLLRFAATRGVYILRMSEAKAVAHFLVVADRRVSRVIQLPCL
jgi:hypothetical protein